jgi:hypothetical protein
VLRMKRFSHIVIVAITAIALVLSCACYEQPKSGSGDVKSVVQKVRPAVVYIETRLAGGDYVYGSGTVIDESGYILTSNHIVEDVQSATVTFADRRQYEGSVVARDNDKDLALLKVAGSGMQFTTVILGDSDAVEVGDELVVIGYPLGLAGDATASRGILSAFRVSEGLRYVQTDAAVSPGNSGGPLLNLNGEMIGIVTFKFVGEAVEGMALAVAVNDVMPFIVAQLGAMNMQRRGNESGKGGGTSPGSVSAGLKLDGCIVFQSDRQIWTMSVDGSNQRKLTSETYGCQEPDWSPDGKRIAFSGWGGICVMNADGSDRETLASGEEPAWSPDGKKIAFVISLPHGGSDICVMNADGSNQIQLTNDTNWDLFPTWAPDGSKIVWMRTIVSRYRIDVFFVMNSDGSNQRQLIFPSDFWDPMAHVWHPAWSPNGKKIAFSCFGDIYTMNPDGSGWRQLTSQSGENYDPAWSPDNKKILFSSNRDGNWELYVMDANGRNQTRLTHTPAHEQNPAWSPR